MSDEINEKPEEKKSDPREAAKLRRQAQLSAALRENLHRRKATKRNKTLQTPSDDSL